MIFVDIKKYQQVGPSIKRSVDIVGTLKLLNVFFRANLTVLSRLSPQVLTKGAYAAAPHRVCCNEDDSIATAC